MTNAELIKVLRCELYGDDECNKSDCPIWSELGCRNGIANRAAANALEAAEKRIAELEKQLPKEGVWIPNSPFTGNCSECGSNGNLKDKYCPNCGAKMKKGEGRQ